MIDQAGNIIYVGKAKNLKKRVSSYFSGIKDAKTQTMVGLINDIEVIVTKSEIEAYLLENSLIKELLPKYNIIFRDDKSYPYIKITKDKFPLLEFHRGRNKKGNYRLFGPYPSANSVKQTIETLQRTFKIRNCSNLNFKNRTRPCLQYQIGRCSAPCVGYISAEDYLEDVQFAEKFINNKTNSLIKDLEQKMYQHSTAKEFENAARIRDQIASLKDIQQQQIVILPNLNTDLDVIAVVKYKNISCVYVLYVRNGKIIGSKYFILPAAASDLNAETAILESFIAQNYLTEKFIYSMPSELIVSHKLENFSLLEQVLLQKLGKKICISPSIRGKKNKLIEMALQNAKNIIQTKIITEIDFKLWFAALNTKLDANITKIACCDISHTQGVATFGGIVFCTDEGLQKKEYKLFNVKSAKKSDDYAAMRETILRYIKSAKNLPDLLLIDGGKGQLKMAEQALAEIEILNNIKLLAIAKGEGRKSGLETIYKNSKGETIDFVVNNKGFLLLQYIRDEAHRFAISKHRQKLKKSSVSSSLESIAGVGPARRKKLLRHFGGIQGLKQAKLEEISSIEGISYKLAKEIYDVVCQKNYV